MDKEKLKIANEISEEIGRITKMIRMCGDGFKGLSFWGIEREQGANINVQVIVPMSKKTTNILALTLEKLKTEYEKQFEEL